MIYYFYCNLLTAHYHYLMIYRLMMIVILTELWVGVNNPLQPEAFNLLKTKINLRYFLSLFIPHEAHTVPSLLERPTGEYCDGK